MSKSLLKCNPLNIFSIIFHFFGLGVFDEALKKALRKLRAFESYLMKLSDSTYFFFAASRSWASLITVSATAFGVAA